MNPFNLDQLNRPGRSGLGRQALNRYFMIIGAILLVSLALTIKGGAVAQSDSVPTEPPDAVSGLPVHNERCATCHGIRGLGDGELAPNLPNPPAAHASLEYLRTAVPGSMFEVITEGIVPKGMPPFGPSSSNPLTDAERWNLIAAIYSLGTPIASVDAGMAIYEENCLACHGESGAGDGPEAGELTSSPGDLSSLDYWANTSNQFLFEALTDSENADHAYDLDDEALWSVVDYVRTFGYGYTDALARFRPLESAIVAGQVTNGTTGEIVSADATALLRGFTQDLDVMITMTETVGTDGFYQFELTDVPQDLFFRVSLDYKDLDFGSDFGQLTFDEPELDMPVTVYEASNDPATIDINQLHLVLTFAEDQVGVSELYVVSNNNPTVFAGETGDPEDGTFRISVPENAQGLSFQRGFGSIDSFVPANEVIQTTTGWADTIPLRPGLGSLTMLVQYALPYEDGVTISHPVDYRAVGINLVLPEAGVSLQNGDGWTDTGQQDMGTATVSTYGKNNIPAGSELTLSLEGKPRLSSPSPTGASTLIRDNTTELIVGIGVALFVIVLAVFTLNRWRTGEDEYLNRDELLQAIADLDEEYEAGEIDEEAYREEREYLKAELLVIWQEEGND